MIEKKVVTLIDTVTEYDDCVIIKITDAPKFDKPVYIFFNWTYRLCIPYTLPLPDVWKFGYDPIRLTRTILLGMLICAYYFDEIEDGARIDVRKAWKNDEIVGTVAFLLHVDKEQLKEILRRELEAEKHARF